jgi:hypothetical protein
MFVKALDNNHAIAGGSNGPVYIIKNDRHILIGMACVYKGDEGTIYVLVVPIGVAVDEIKVKARLKFLTLAMKISRKLCLANITNSSLRAFFHLTVLTILLKILVSK